MRTQAVHNLLQEHALCSALERAAAAAFQAAAAPGAHSQRGVDGPDALMVTYLPARDAPAFCAAADELVQSLLQPHELGPFGCALVLVNISDMQVRAHCGKPLHACAMGLWGLALVHLVTQLDHFGLRVWPSVP